MDSEADSDYGMDVCVCVCVCVAGGDAHSFVVAAGPAAAAGDVALGTCRHPPPSAP